MSLILPGKEQVHPMRIFTVDPEERSLHLLTLGLLSLVVMTGTTVRRNIWGQDF